MIENHYYHNRKVSYQSDMHRRYKTITRNMFVSPQLGGMPAEQAGRFPPQTTPLWIAAGTRVTAGKATRPWWIFRPKLSDFALGRVYIVVERNDDAIVADGSAIADKDAALLTTACRDMRQMAGPLPLSRRFDKKVSESPLT